MKNKILKKLYWVKTKDGDENWFVIAKSRRSAASFHADYEGYYIGEARAILICQIEEDYENKEVYHAQLNMLKDLGFEIISRGPARVVRREGIIYREGITSHSVYFSVSDGKIGVYIIRVCGTNKFKIGATNNFRNRFRNLQTGSSDELEPFFFYRTEKAEFLERYLHKKYKKFCIGREWFKFDSLELDCLHADAKKFKLLKNSINK